MKYRAMFQSLALTGVVCAALHAEPQIGDPAPNFSLRASDGKTYTLSDYKGRWVVLEWFNDRCPFIRKHYDSGNMQSLQEKYGEQGVVWLSICSSAPNREGYMTDQKAQEIRSEEHIKSVATLLDPHGKTGRTYGAKTTPHMFIINPAGTLVYKGAIDDKPTTDAEDVPGAVNYVSQALDEGLAGKPITVSQTKAYGCSVKYE